MLEGLSLYESATISLFSHLVLISCKLSTLIQINEMTSNGSHVTQDRIRDMSKPPLPPSIKTRQAWETDRNITNESSFFR